MITPLLWFILVKGEKIGSIDIDPTRTQDTEDVKDKLSNAYSCIYTLKFALDTNMGRVSCSIPDVP